MTHSKFEITGSMRSDLNALEALLASNSTITLSWTELVEAVCLARNKAGKTEDKCIGYKITDKEIIFLF